MGEKHVLIQAVFLLFQLRGPTLNESREQGSTLDRGGEGRGRWEFIEELGIMCSGSPWTSCFPFSGNPSREMLLEWDKQAEEEEEEGGCKTWRERQHEKVTKIAI